MIVCKFHKVRDHCVCFSGDEWVIISSGKALSSSLVQADENRLGAGLGNLSSAPLNPLYMGGQWQFHVYSPSEIRWLQLVLFLVSEGLGAWVWCFEHPLNFSLLLADLNDAHSKIWQWNVCGTLAVVNKTSASCSLCNKPDFKRPIHSKFYNILICVIFPFKASKQLEYLWANHSVCQKQTNKITIFPCFCGIYVVNPALYARDLSCSVGSYVQLTKVQGKAICHS